MSEQIVIPLPADSLLLRNPACTACYEDWRFTAVQQ